jgi:flagellar basal body-associated protein FliL
MRDTPKDPNGRSGGAIAGIVIGAVVVVGASAGLAYWWFVVKAKAKPIANAEP